MARSAILSVAAVMAAVAAVTPESRVPTLRVSPSDALAAALPAQRDEGLPPLPSVSRRTANYTIEARLDPDSHTLNGRLVLLWTNPSDEPQSLFPFHLYWNAYRNNLSTFAREMAAEGFDPFADENRLGYVHIGALRKDGEDLLPRLQFVQPDDQNPEDRTLAEVRSDRPVGPGETARFEIEWQARVPHGSMGRAGFVHDYNFIAQWFPKIAGFAGGRFNRHQFHASSEFFSNFGNYDVSLTLPRGFEVGATGWRTDERPNPDGTVTFRYVQEDVHDFAWLASRRALVRTGRFEADGYPPVELRLLVQPEHAHLAERILEATRVALRAFGAWSAPYPYRQLTIVDPAWGSSSGGMEYPTLFTTGASVRSPREAHEPEAVTIHECGHQFWHGLVATNEYEEPWLDEGFTSYHTAKAEAIAYGPAGQERRYFGAGGGLGWPIVAPGVSWGRGEKALLDVRANGTLDPMDRKAWEYRSGRSYWVNAYSKPSLVLQTLEGLVGEETMTRILRTYARRYRFEHPTGTDFIATVEEVTGRSFQAFFDETLHSSELVDYAVTVRQEGDLPVRGFVDGEEGPSKAESGTLVPAATSVIVERRGGARIPVDVLVEFDDGTKVREAWDTQAQWKTFRYAGRRVVAATVDPDGLITLDVDRRNNRFELAPRPIKDGARRAAARFLFHLQNFLLTHEILG